jgi:S-adenosylmethionine hydrolase
MPPPNIITLTTDFGTADSYAAIMKGVMLSLCPACSIVDITHAVAPGDIEGGGFCLEAACRYFPRGSVHVAVVDPGVGTGRRAIIVATDSCFFVGPDNGIFTFALRGSRVRTVVDISNPALMLPRPCPTFHGRDIFAPAAAHLCRGEPPESFGSPVGDCCLLDSDEPLVTAGGVQGRIMHVDRFENLITNLRRDFLERIFGDRPFTARVGTAAAARLVRTNADAGVHEAVCLYGSSGHLEIAVKNGSALQHTGACRGHAVLLSAGNPEG